MKKSVKIIAAVLILFLVPLGAARLWLWAQRPLIRFRVTAHLDALTLAAERALATGDAPVRTTDLYIPDGGDAVWYQVRDGGFGSATQYFGYCYTADGDPHPYPGMEEYDEGAAMFGFRWDEPGGDNGCYVEHIDGNFYYYKIWF